MFWAHWEGVVAQAPGWLDPCLLCGCGDGHCRKGSWHDRTPGSKVAKNSHHVTIYYLYKSSGTSFVNLVAEIIDWNLLVELAQCLRSFPKIDGNQAAAYCT